MGKKNNEKPESIIDLYNGSKGSYIICRLNLDGGYFMKGAPKNAKDLLPLIDRKTYKWITPRAKESFLSSPSSGKTSRLIKKLREVELSKLI